MALDLTQQYPQQVDGSTPAYPLGKARNVTSPDDNNATPLDEAWLNDHFGFQQALLAEAGIVPSGEPDQVGASQYLEAIRSLGTQAENIDATADGGVPFNQAQKNSQSVYAAEYGATGDGTTDDTAAFELLESNVTGQRIDLQGKTYVVSSISRYKNDYYNGYFKVGGSLITANGEFKLFGTKTTTPINLHRDTQVKNSSLHYKLVKGGLSPNNVVQSFAVDEVNGYVYTHHTTDNSGQAWDVSIINRYAKDELGVNTYLDYSLPVKEIGHQGLAVQYKDDGTTYLWSSSPYTNAGGRDDSAVRFTYKPSADGEINDVQTFQLFPENLIGGSSSPTISYCGNYLVVEANRTVDGISGNYIRVFDLHDLTAAGDYSNRYLSEFFVSVTHDRVNESTGVQDTVPALQSIACDGAYIYILSASTYIQSKATIAVYTMTGELVTENRNVSVGKDVAAVTDSGTFYEPENLTISTINGTPRLMMQIVVGDVGERDCLVYAFGGGGSFVKSTSTKPAYIGKSTTIDYGVPTGETLTVGSYNYTNNTYSVFARYNSDGSWSHGGTSTAYHGIHREASNNAATVHRIQDSKTDFTGNMTQITALTNTASNWNIARWYSGGTTNTQYGAALFTFTGDGNGKCAGAWTGGGADYAEYFEWADGNKKGQDRRGMLVAIDKDSKIRIAKKNDVVIGVVSANPSIVGNSAWNEHHSRYLRDKYNAYALDENGNRIDNPDYDESLEYEPRENRQEWGLIGLLGKVVVNEGQNVPDNWVRLGMTSTDTCEYLVR